jgi:hypothetical protein
LTKGAGWYPDYQTRLLKVARSHYDPERQVHELVLLDGEEGTLQNHFIHYNYGTLGQFIAKQQKYVQFDAQIMYEQGIKPKPKLHLYSHSSFLLALCGTSRLCRWLAWVQIIGVDGMV